MLKQGEQISSLKKCPPSSKSVPPAPLDHFMWQDDAAGAAALAPLGPPPRGSQLESSVAAMSRTPLFLTTALAHLRDALDMIPMEQKEDYVHVAGLLPNLIKKESDPIKFLRSASYNPWAAARSLVLYWEYRHRLFQDRWLLHMDETGAGTLDSKDIDLLRSGWIAFVTLEDKAKDRVLLIDHGKFKGHAPETQCRVLFYLCATASDETAQTVGLTAIRLITTKTEHGEPAPTRRQFELARLGWQIVREAMPLRLNLVILLKIGRRDKGNMINFFINRVGKSLFTLLGGIEPVVLSIDSAEEAAGKLMQYGVVPESLPRSHGGTWSYDRLFEWKNVVSQDDDIVRVATVARVSENIRRGASDGVSAGAMYAKRAYQKKKQKVKDLEQNLRELMAEKAKLVTENDFLESLYEKAADIVALQ